MFDFKELKNKKVPHFADGGNYMLVLLPNCNNTIKEIHNFLEKENGYKIKPYISTGWYQDRKIEEKDWDLKNVCVVSVILDVKDEKLTGNVNFIRYDLWKSMSKQKEHLKIPLL